MLVIKETGNDQVADVTAIQPKVWGFDSSSRWFAFSLGSILLAADSFLKTMQFVITLIKETKYKRNLRHCIAVGLGACGWPFSTLL